MDSITPPETVENTDLNRLNEKVDLGNISYNGALKRNEVLPDYALNGSIRLNTKVNSVQLGESINDGSEEFARQVIESCVEDDQKGFAGEDELKFLDKLGRLIENRTKKVRLRLQNIDRRIRYNQKQKS